MDGSPEAPRRSPQGWGWAAVVLGMILMIFAAFGHIAAMLYVSLAVNHADTLDRRLTLGVHILYTVLILVVAVLGVVAAGIGLRIPARSQSGRGVAIAGLFLSVVGLIS